MPSRIELEPDLEELGRLADAVEAFTAAAGLGPEVAGRLTVALDEVVTNAILHGRLPPEARIAVELALVDGEVVATVADPGPAFDPLADPPPVDTTAPLEERPIGGLGLFLVRNLARELAYRREAGCNHLTLWLAAVG